VGKTRVMRYKTKPEAAEENQRLIAEVFAELAETKPEGLRYASFRLDDGVTFVHIVEFEGEHDPFSEVVAFKAFIDTFNDRLDGQAERPESSIIGSYRFLTP
jgi:hypothetical protein